MSTTPAPPRRRVILSGAVVRTLAVLAGMTLGAMIASFAAAPGAPPLPSRKEALDLAVLVLPGQPFDPEWYNDTSVQDRASREAADVGLTVPDWLQFLVGDNTQEASTSVVWAPGSAEEPGLGTGYISTAAGNLRAGGWDVEESAAHGVIARKGTLLLEFYADDYAAPTLDIVRVPPTWHRWAVLAGAVLGGVGAFVLARSVRRRENGEDAHTSTFLLLLGVMAVLPSFLVVVAVSVFELVWHPWIDTLLWRAGRFVPFGATLNAGVGLLAVGWIWHLRRDRSAPVDELDELDDLDAENEDAENEDEPPAGDRPGLDRERELVVEADPLP
ncbi:hypothetical protein [Phytomonospora endophytica]|uniref:Uncharacterized protein n=1 Tax=Phytomonospora endophytica TaxID=714109 RepID=A0A841G4N4_9ACTN|nr:hypothetical protein [Phytomonospora endophytica]MBB6039699.1 hypothetical protein [Phytomonospora endophytica]GIG70964.1 hypothetical protein Pen01_72590 [Phytomonospora endophytica]